MYEEHQRLLGLRDYLDVVRRRRRLVASVVVATVLAAAFASALTRFTHESSVELLVPAPSQSGVVGRAVFGDADLRTQQRLLTSMDVTEPAAQDLGIPSDPASLRELLDRVTVELIADTSIMVISARHEEPEMSAAIPLAFADSYIDLRQEVARDRIDSARRHLEARIEEIGAQLSEGESSLGPDQSQEENAEGAGPAQDDDLRNMSERDRLLAQLTAAERELTELALVEEFAPGGRVISPVALPQQGSLRDVLLRNMVLGAILGATLGLILAFVRDWTEDRIVHERDITALTGRPLMGRVQRSRSDDRRISYPSDPASSDVYRTLKTTARVGLGAPGRQGEPTGNATDTRLPFPAILVTDIDGRSSGSEVAANLAVAFARSGTRTVLVDARHHPGASAYLLEAPTGAGLNEVIAGECPIGTASRPTREQGLRAVTPGRDDPRARDALTAGRFAEVMRPLEGDIDLVVIDAGPGSSAGEVLEMSIAATTTVLVAAWERSTRQSLRDTMHRLRGAGADILGTVVVEGPSAREPGEVDPATSAAGAGEVPPRSDANDHGHRTGVSPG